MGTATAVAGAFALYDSNRRDVPLELSMVAIFSPRPGNLRGEGAAECIVIRDSSSHCACLDYCCRDRRFNLTNMGHLRVSAYMDLYRFSCGLVVPRAFVRHFRI